MEKRANHENRQNMKNEENVKKKRNREKCENTKTWKKNRKLRKMQNSEKRKIAKTLKSQKTRKWKNVHFWLKILFLARKFKGWLDFKEHATYSMSGYLFNNIDHKTSKKFRLDVNWNFLCYKKVCEMSKNLRLWK